MRLESSNECLQSAFEWALNKTKAFVVTGIKNGDINKGDGGKWYGPHGAVADSPTEPWAQPRDYKPSFWAGYFDRTAYYIRDFVHQAEGAYLAGLEKEIFNMYYTFVSNASKKTGWFAPWSFNFDNSIYYMDTPDFEKFVREITAQFELVEKAYQLYLWSGDSRYIQDDVIFNFIEKIMTVFIEHSDGLVFGDKNGIPEGLGDIWQSTSTYNERGFYAVEAGDSIAAMYQAIRAYANILKLRGNAEESQAQFIRAEKLREYFNTEWSVVEGSDMFAYAIDEKGEKHYEWYKNGTEIHGGASLFFIPLKRLAYEGRRNDCLLDYIHQAELDENSREDNIESLTYLPEVFFSYHQSERAWYWMRYILSQKDLPHERKEQGTNGDYPEISFTFISQVVGGLMGICPNAAEGTLSVCPDFPEDMDDIKLYDLKFGDYCVDIELEREKAVLKNNSKKALLWSCRFLNNGNECVKTAVAQPSEIVEITI